MNGKFYFILLLLLFIISSCTHVEITRDYIYNSNWGAEDGKGFSSIQKINFNLDLGKLTEIDVNTLSREYKVDSTFCYSFYSRNAKNKKVYFNRENEKGGVFRNLCHSDLATTVKTIGRLELETWYRISSINYQTIHYVYIDEQGKSHMYVTYNWGPW